MPQVPLDDRQIEQYSRQIVLAEVGAQGQARLLAARIAIDGSGVAAERALGYLAAAGVGTIAAPATLHGVVDSDHLDLTLAALPPRNGATAGSGRPFDAAIVVGEGDATLAARRMFWVADGRASETPPCRGCAEAALGPAAPQRLPALMELRDAMLGTVVATEVVKALLGIGAGLGGRVLTYDPEVAGIAAHDAPARATCPVCAATRAEG